MKSSHDIIVIGGGVMGSAVAFELAKRSADVLLVDNSLPGRATSASAGGLWPVGATVGLGCGVIHHAENNSDESRGAVHSPHSGIKGASPPAPLPTVLGDFLIESNRRFPGLSGEIRDLTGVDIEHRTGRGLLFVVYSEDQWRFIDRVTSSMPPDWTVQRLSQRDVRQLEPQITSDILGGVLLEGEHQVNPMMLAEGYKRGAERLGATLSLSTRVRRLNMERSRIVGVEIDGRVVGCQTVVNASGVWAPELAQTIGLDLPVRPVRSQIVHTEPLPQTLSVCVCTSTAYLVQNAHGEVFIGGKAALTRCAGGTTDPIGFDTSITVDAMSKLSRAALRCVPALRRIAIKRMCVGLYSATPDDLPILGRVNEVAGYINAVGSLITGVIASPLTGETIAQTIMNESTSYPLDAFRMERFVQSTFQGVMGGPPL